MGLFTSLASAQDTRIESRYELRLKSWKGRVRPEELVYDNKAYSFTSTYHAGTGTLQIYATRPTAPTVPGGKPEYHMK